MTTLADIDPKTHILIQGARLHNLKNIDLAIPRNQLVVITGLSGSGKSSLAFDTLYAEGQRRYVESLSSYARQFLGKLDKPQVDSIKGIAPAIAIEQKVNSTNPRSTVGTTTEIYDYLKLLYARIGKTFSPVSGKLVKISGASTYYKGSVTAYAVQAKEEILAVPKEQIVKYGVVSAEVAKAMAIGVRKLMHADIGLGTTGYAESDENIQAHAFLGYADHMHSDAKEGLGDINTWISNQIMKQLKPLIFSLYLPFLLINLFFILINLGEVMFYVRQKRMEKSI